MPDSGKAWSAALPASLQLRQLHSERPLVPRARATYAPGGESGEIHTNVTDSDKVSTGSYAFLGFLTLLNVMNFVDRQLLASFANFIVPDLGLSNTEFGLLTGL